MPKSKNNNVCRTECGDSNNYGENLDESEDSRSMTEKVSDLTDLFIGDYHIDTDIIHAVLEECNWNVKQASEKLFEVFFSSKPNEESKKNEPDDLALIAVSILRNDGSSNEQCSSSEREGVLSQGNLDGQIHPSVKHPKQNNNCLRQKVSSNENNAQYNYSAQNLDVKPSSESKTLFESKAGHHDFYNKNSFGDMVLNMEHSSVSKTSSQNVMKGDSLQEGNQNLRFTPSPEKTKPRLDFSHVSMDDSTSLNKVENVGANSKNSSSAFYSDKSMESLIRTSHSPSISKEWDKFYQQMNVPPLHIAKTSPDIDINDLQKTVTDSDIQVSMPSKNEDKPVQSKKSSGSGQENNSTGSQRPGYKPNNHSFQIPKSASVAHSNKSPSPEKDEVQGHVDRENNARKLKEQQIPENSSLNAVAPEFVPRVLDAKQPMTTRKSPTKQTKPAAQIYPYNGNLLQSPEKDKNTIFKKGKKVSYDQSQSLPPRSTSAEGITGKPVLMVDPIEHRGGREARAFNTPKPKLQMNGKGMGPHHDPRHRQFDKSKTQSPNDDSTPTADSSVVISPFSFNVISQSNGNKKFTGKKRVKVPKSQDAAVDPQNTTSSLTGLENRSSSGGNPTIVKSPHSYPLPQRPPVLTLPPSLLWKPHFDQPSNSVPAPHNGSNKKDVSSHLVPKAMSAPENNIVANKVQFVGVKTPLGKLKHYIDKKRHVMFILRGLPGSGKSYLAWQLVSECQRFNVQATNLSSDAYFCVSGQYNFNRQQLDEAHIWNQQRARQCLKEKYPIVIIDNTNTTMWEMMHYAEMAILNGYDIQVCEPDTQWKNKIPELVRRNQHDVSRDQIKRMKDRYEILTTDDVIREASKSLQKKNKLPSKTPEPPVSVPVFQLKPQVQGHPVISGNMTTSVPNPKSTPIPSLMDGINMDRLGNQTPLDQGLTQWNPAMEQRVMAKKSKKTSVSKTQSKSKPPEITLDFLNNSIKKALVDIEKLADESTVEDSQAVVEEFKCEYLDKDFERTVETLSSVGNKSKVDTVSNDDDDKGEKLVPGSDESVFNQGLAKTQTGDSTVLVIASVPDSSPSPQTFDTSGSTNDSFYSCVSEVGQDVSEKGTESRQCEQRLNLSECISYELGVKETDAILLQDLKTSDSADLSNPELTSETETVVGDKDWNVLATASSRNSTENVISIPVSVESSNNSMNKFIKAGYGNTDSDPNSSHKERMMKTEVKANDDDEGVITINEESGVRKMTLPVHAASLVVYSDSEEEDEASDDMKVLGMMSEVITLDSNTDTKVCVHVNENDSNSLKDELSGTIPCRDLNGVNVLFEAHGNRDQEDPLSEIDRNNQPTLTRLHISKDCDRHKDEDDDLDNNAVSQLDPNEEFESFLMENNVSEVTEKSPESSSSTREESPALEDNVENSPRKKKKKKKIKPVVNQGPFLEECLKEKSKTENWSSFFFNNPSMERQLSPSKVIPKVTVCKSSSQCEPYYFSMVYRLNSASFSNQQPIDVSNCDVVVLQASKEDSWEERCQNAGVSAIVQRKAETTDRSTETDETLVSEEVDLETLHACFPEYSRKQLGDVMSVYQNDMEWITNSLLDSSPLIDLGDEEVEENDELSPETKNGQNSPEKNEVVKSLARLCRDMVGNNRELDKDDFEQQVIHAGQTRLQEIEKFAWTRLHSYSRENSHYSVMGVADSWPDDFNLDHFSARSSQDEIRHDPLKSFQPPTLFPASECTMMGSSSSLRTVDFEVDKEYLAMSPERNAMDTSQPVLPLHFIQCLENCFGPLNVHVDRSGLALSENTARKIHNCLKLQISKKQVRGSDHDKQMQEDEAMAIALQEAEHAARDDVSAQSSSVPGWTNQKPSWMTSGNVQQQQFPDDSSITRKKPRSTATTSSRVNSVSETLHQLRGSWPKQLKPYKFHAKLQRSQNPSVWTVKSHTKHKADDMQSIMKEEIAREARLKHMLQVNQATGDKDVLATKIKRSRLKLMFPFLPPDVLEEIFMNNGYSLETTVEVLENHYDRKPVPVSAEKEEQELDEILRYSDQDEGFQYLDEEVAETVSYDDLRKEAQFRMDLANECRQKALRYHGEGMHHAAFFYRQEVKKYLSEKDEANQRAARLLFDIGSERLVRENTLDLHSYHINEAIEAVNLAMEMKREEYHRQPERRRAYLTVITGRGRNSKGGIPKLKPAIISHLNNRGLRFEETAPGMFKLHIFQE